MIDEYESSDVEKLGKLELGGCRKWGDMKIKSKPERHQTANDLG